MYTETMQRSHQICLSVGLCFLLSFGLIAESHLERTIRRPDSPRELGLGGATTGLAEGLGGLGSNPAGVGMPGFELKFGQLDQTNTFSRIYATQGIYMSPFAYQRVLHQTASGDEISLQRYTLGHRGRGGISWGLSYNDIQSETASTNEDGWSTDFGLLFQLTPDLRYGLTINDFLHQDLSVKTTGQMGVVWHPFYKDMPHFMLTTDLQYRAPADGDDELVSAAGIEFLMTQGLVVRGGLAGDNPSFGLSLLFPALELSYGTQLNYNNTDEPIHMLSVSLGQGIVKTKIQRQYAIFKPSGFAEFHLSGNLISGRSEISLFGGQKIGANDLLRLIHMASDDPTCEGFVIRIGALSDSIASVALVQEIRTELLRARKQGKKILAYIEGWARLPEYYLATAADSIVMPELGSISHLGLEMEVTKAKTFMNNFGFDTQIVAGGAYKGAANAQGDPLTDTERSIFESILGDLYHHVLFDIKKARNLDWEKVAHIFDGRIITARKAKKLGLVDDLAYWDPKTFGSYLGPNLTALKTYPLTQFSVLPQPPSIFSPFNRIAVVEIDGKIIGGRSGSNSLFGGKVTGSDEVVAILKALTKQSGTRGVLLRINSPGGSMLDSDRIHEAILALRASGKTVYASMGNMAASGGYYIAMAADKIFANRSTLTGSIGVISSYTNMAEFNDVLGIQKESIKTGEHMDMMSSSRPLSEAELEMLKDHIEGYYQVFTGKLKKQRNLSDSEVETVAQGQLITGEKALDLKLVDEVGGFYEAVNDLSQKVGIEGEPELQYFRPRIPTLIQVLKRLFKI